jgi:hypothetical protein
VSEARSIGGEGAHAARETSLAVWNVPSPVMIAEAFRVIVGVKSAGACTLTGAKVAIHDERGAAIGEGVLGEAPWPGTALYWTEIALVAPAKAGTFSWSAAFAGDTAMPPHSGAASRFSFVAVERPAHRSRIMVVAGEAGTPVENVHIALGPYRAATDGDGIAVMETPAGHFELTAWHAEFDVFTKSVEIAKDGVLRVALTRRPEEIAVWG